MPHAANRMADLLISRWTPGDLNGRATDEEARYDLNSFSIDDPFQSISTNFATAVPDGTIVASSRAFKRDSLLRAENLMPSIEDPLKANTVSVGASLICGDSITTTEFGLLSRIGKPITKEQYISKLERRLHTLRRGNGDKLTSVRMRKGPA